MLISRICLVQRVQHHEAIFSAGFLCEQAFDRQRFLMPVAFNGIKNTLYICRSFQRLSEFQMGDGIHACNFTIIRV